MTIYAAVDLLRILVAHFNPAAPWYRSDSYLLEDIINIYQMDFRQWLKFEDIWTDDELI